MRSYEDLAIAELVVFPIILIANLFVLLRHGLGRQSGWIFLTTFCIIRIIGASFGVAFGETGDVNDFVWSVILGSVGIGALLASTAGLLQRVIDGTSTRRRKQQGGKTRFEEIVRFIPIVSLLYRLLYAGPATATSRRSRIIQVTHILSLVALIICIVGGTKQTSSSTSDMSEGRKMLKSGIIIFICLFAILLALAVYTTTEFSRVPSSEKRILAVVLAAMPLILVRIIWSVLAYFSDIRTFNIIDGSVGVRAVMSTLEEFLVIIAYTIVGLMVPPQYQPPQDREIRARGKCELQAAGKDAQQLPNYGPA